LFAGGIGRPFFSTDSSAALLASELEADVVIKATKVDGVYDKNPNEFSDAKKFERISFRDVLVNRLNVMDSSAFALCMENDTPIIVLSVRTDSSHFTFENIGRAIRGERIGTTICNEHDL
jgi:uridylate kinase